MAPEFMKQLAAIGQALKKTSGDPSPPAHRFSFAARSAADIHNHRKLLRAVRIIFVPVERLPSLRTVAQKKAARGTA